MKRLVFAAATAALGLALPAAAPAAAQQAASEHWHPRWGSWSLSFELPDGGGAGFGFWKQRSHNLALGLTVDGSLSWAEREGGDASTVQSDLSIGPSLKRYWWRDSPVAPFFRTDLRGLYQRSSVGDQAQWRFGGGLTLALGAEWFPAEGVGIAGHTGLQGSYVWTTDTDDLTGDETRLFLDLFTSALTIQVYF